MPIEFLAAPAGARLVPPDLGPAARLNIPAEALQELPPPVRQRAAAVIDLIGVFPEMYPVRRRGLMKGYRYFVVMGYLDLYLSTLAEYVEALGGRLEIRAVFPDRAMRITQFERLPK